MRYQNIESKIWYEKGAAKAIRNAKSRTIPTEVEAMIIAAAKSESNRVKKVSDKDLESKKSNGGNNKEEPRPATEKQINYIKGLVEKKLQGDWSMACKQYELATKEDLLKRITIADANEIIEWLESMK